MVPKTFHAAPMAEEHGRQICGWRYDTPYDIYSWPTWEEMAERKEEYADPGLRQRQYASILDAEGELCGFAQFFPMVGVTRIGLGMRPELCGQGDGVVFVQAIVAEARRRRPDDEIDLEVLEWNDRARKTYERAGFAATDRYERMTPRGSAMFYCMVYGAKKKAFPLS